MIWSVPRRVEIAKGAACCKFCGFSTAIYIIFPVYVISSQTILIQFWFYNNIVVRNEPSPWNAQQQLITNRCLLFILLIWFPFYICFYVALLRVSQLLRASLSPSSSDTLQWRRLHHPRGSHRRHILYYQQWPGERGQNRTVWTSFCWTWSHVIMKSIN